jgi:hypothetical protein
MENNRDVEYEEYSRTIRQMPENYLLAFQKGNQWVFDLDLQADPDIGKATFEIVRLFNGKYAEPAEFLSLLKTRIEEIHNHNIKRIIFSRAKELDDKDFTFGSFLARKGWRGDIEENGNVVVYKGMESNIIALAAYDNSKCKYKVWTPKFN